MYGNLDNFYTITQESRTHAANPCAFLYVIVGSREPPYTTESITDLFICLLKANMKKNIALPIVTLTVLLLSCSKQGEERTDEGFDPHPTWTDDSTNNFWEKSPGDCITTVSPCEGDITIKELTL